MLKQAAESDTNCARIDLDEHRLGELASRWKSYEEDGLVLRHETGKFLLETFGAKRLRYGEEVMQHVSEALSISESELFRMRKFAIACPDLDKYREEHSECSTWTQVKALLPTLAPKRSGAKQQSKAKTRQSSVKEVLSSVTELRKRLAGFALETGRRSTRLRKDLTALRQSIDCVLEALGKEGTPPKARREAA
jgi:hypothetical protein